MQYQAPPSFVWVLVQMVNAIGIQQRRAAFDAMHFITFFQKELGQIRPVLTGYSRD
jgi:hypothetical protein